MAPGDYRVSSLAPSTSGQVTVLSRRGHGFESRWGIEASRGTLGARRGVGEFGCPRGAHNAEIAGSNPASATTAG